MRMDAVCRVAQLESRLYDFCYESLVLNLEWLSVLTWLGVG